MKRSSIVMMVNNDEDQKTTSGIDNPGFQDEEQHNGSNNIYVPMAPGKNGVAPNNGAYLNSSVDTSMLTEVKQQQGSIERKKKDKEVAEAVNLELVNMKPYTGEKQLEVTNGVNGIPVKKESDDLELGSSYNDSYDEYFVPVNEHRKYMRGEKLYVTKDKRRSQSWKRCVCWSVGLALLAVAILIAALAGTGVILAQEEPIIGSDAARQLGDGTKSTQSPVVESSSFTPPPPLPESPGPPPTTDMSALYVPRVLEGHLVLDNKEFTSELLDPSSSQYQNLSAQLEAELMTSLFDLQTRQFGASDINLKVYKFAPGSIVVYYYIAWVFKEGIRNAPDPISKETVRQRLQNTLNRSGGYLGSDYHIVSGSVLANNVIDICQLMNGGCSHGCMFDYQKAANFICTCPLGMALDRDGKNCTDKVHLPVEEPSVSRVLHPDAERYPQNEESSSAEPSASPEPEPSPEPAASPEPSPEPSPEHEMTPEPPVSPEPTPEPSAEPAASPEPSPEPSPEHEMSPEPPVSPEPSPEPAASPEPSPEPSPEHEMSPEPPVSPEPTPEPSPEHEMNPEHSLEHEILPEPSVTPEPTAEPSPEHEMNPEPPVSPEPTPEPSPEHEMNSEHQVTPDPGASPEPSAELEASPEHEIYPVTPGPEHEASTEHESPAKHQMDPEHEADREIWQHNNAYHHFNQDDDDDFYNDHYDDNEGRGMRHQDYVDEYHEMIDTEPPAEEDDNTVHSSATEKSHDMLAPLHEDIMTTMSAIINETSPVKVKNVFVPEIVMPTTTDRVEPTTISPEMEEIVGNTAEEPTFHLIDNDTAFNNSQHVVLDAMTTMLPIITTMNDDKQHMDENIGESTEMPETTTVMMMTMEGRNNGTVLLNVHSVSENNIVSSEDDETSRKAPRLDDDAMAVTNPTDIDEPDTVDVTTMGSPDEKNSSLTVEMPEKVQQIEKSASQSTDVEEANINVMTTEIPDEKEGSTSQPTDIDEPDKVDVTTMGTPDEKNSSLTIEMSEKIMQKQESQSTGINEPDVDMTTTGIPEEKEESTSKSTDIENLDKDDITTMRILEKMGEMMLGISEKMHQKEESMSQSPDIEDSNATTMEIPEKEEESTSQLANMDEQDVTTMKIPEEKQGMIMKIEQGKDKLVTANRTSENDLFEESRVVSKELATNSSTMTQEEEMTTLISLMEMTTMMPEVHQTHNSSTEDNFIDNLGPVLNLDKTSFNTTTEGVEMQVSANKTDDADNIIANENVSTTSASPEIQPVTPTVEENHIDDADIPIIVANIEDDDEVLMATTGPIRFVSEPMAPENEVDTGVKPNTSTTEKIKATSDVEKTNVSTAQDNSPSLLSVPVDDGLKANDFSEENKLLIDAGKLTSTTSTTTASYANEIHILPPSAEANVIPPTSQSILLLNPITGEIHRQPDEEILLKNQTSSIADILQAVAPEIKEEVKKKDLSSQSSKKPIHPAGDLATSDVEPNKTLINLFEKKSVGDKASPKPEKELPSKKVSKYGVLSFFDDVKEMENVTTTQEVPSSEVVPATKLEITTISPSSSATTENTEVKVAEIVSNLNAVEEELIYNKKDKKRTEIESKKSLKLDEKSSNASDVVATTIIPLAAGLEPAVEHEKPITMIPPEIHVLTPSPESDAENLVHEVKQQQQGTVKTEEVPDNATRPSSTEIPSEAQEDNLSSNILESRMGDTNLELEGNSTDAQDRNLTSSTLPAVGFSKCAAVQFQCVNGTSREGAYCVPLSAKCDSVRDCSDGSDEEGCVERGCTGNFQCSTTGQCLKRHLVCNGIVDCNDGTDEINCDSWKCLFDEFQCPSGRCIPVLWQCDGKPDCSNHTDEFNCQSSCGNDEYLCPEGWCIPMTWRCNGEMECANGDDEKLCECSLEQFRCKTGGCIPKSQVCDGLEHCPDLSDEWNCVRLHNDTMKLQIRSADDTWHPVCADGWDSDWSDLACQNLGYSKATFTEKPTGPEDNPAASNTSFYQLKARAGASAANVGARLTSSLEKAVDNTSCASASLLEISCQDFTCGIHSTAYASRVVGGDGATNGQWPSVALLYHTRHKTSCTASIISPKWLLSSYNCLHLRDKLMLATNWVAFGGGSMFEVDKPETQIREVQSIVPYPQVKYNQFLFNNDIALIELAQPLQFTRYVGAICLPEKDIEPRQLCVTAGWGYTSPGEINFSQYLHYLPIPTIDLADCNSTKHYAGFITENEICAGYTDAERSPCYNDEGAPLMCISEGGVWELQGVLSYHSNCGRGYHPSIFSSITAVRSWVEKTVGSRFERKSTYNVRRR